jgi:FtsH ternary system domain X3
VRVRVRFRYNADTGEVETFIVEDIGGDERAVDHDGMHDRITSDVARIIERDALIEEVLPGAVPELNRRRTTQDEGTGREDRRVSE